MRRIFTNYKLIVNSKNIVRSCSQLIEQPERKIKSALDNAAKEDYENVGRNLVPTFNFAAYANESPNLQQFVKLGVNLSKYDNKPKLQHYILQLNFENDVKPYVKFLHDNGVEADAIGSVLTKNIELCKESLDDLQIRVNYLETKKFTKENIANIIQRNPKWLSHTVIDIDERLGWFQKNYKLTGDEVRTMVNGEPKLVTFNLNHVKVSNFVFEEEMCFEKWQIKSLLLKRPRLFLKGQKNLIAAFEYVHNEMNVPIDLISRQPDILMGKIQRIRERHVYLKSLGRAQYNPNLPGYVSLDAFISSNDVEFCTNIAKSSVLSFNTFLKTL